MKIIDEQLLNEVQVKAKDSPRLRMRSALPLCYAKNYNFHGLLEDKCHRFLNAVEPGTVVPIHHHPTKDETFILLRGKVRVSTFNDDGTIRENMRRKE